MRRRLGAHAINAFGAGQSGPSETGYLIRPRNSGGIIHVRRMRGGAFDECQEMTTQNDHRRPTRKIPRR